MEEINFSLNRQPIIYLGPAEKSLLSYLRNDQKIKSVKDGCSGQGACGACLVEVNGKPALSCLTKMSSLNHAEIITPEGIPPEILDILATSFVGKGAVQCGFCTPGFLMRTKILFEENNRPTTEEIIKALKWNLCRCTGYVKIIDAIRDAIQQLSEKAAPGHGENYYHRYQGLEMAKGAFRYVDDMEADGMLHGALLFSKHPRARISRIDFVNAQHLEGVKMILTAKDIPGNPYTGLIFPDWPLMIAEGEITRYIGDVLALVIADNEDNARNAAKHIQVEYDIMTPVCEPEIALKDEIRVHPEKSNVVDICRIQRGDTEKALINSAWTYENTFETQRIEHAFLEPEAALALPDHEGLILYSQGQGAYVDRRQVASLLNLKEDRVNVIQIATGGGFGGKEDLTVQGHAAMAALLCQKPVKVKLSREESIRMHPKRHPVKMQLKIGCDAQGMLTALDFYAIGDSGAYASVGNKVMERVAGHAAGAYYIPDIRVEALTVYTNNIPCGAMRGFGVPQSVFAIESAIDELCKMGGFDRWKFRYNNALREGLMTSTGQVLEKGVGVRACLEAVKEDFYSSRFAGIACGIKNSGVGNGMIDESKVSIEINNEHTVVIHHGWSEMGQGVHQMAIKILNRETGIPESIIRVISQTKSELVTGMTTSSRATALLGNAIIDACKTLKRDLESMTLEELSGKTYTGSFVCDWTTKPGVKTDRPFTHFAYGYAAQVTILDENGNIKKIVAAHDVGKNINPVAFEGQIEGSVHMGLGYALTEDLPMENGYLISDRLRDCGVLRAAQMPEVKVISVEVADPVGPYGGKGIGEIGMVPTAASVANALSLFDGKRRTRLPMQRKPKGTTSLESNT